MILVTTTQEILPYLKNLAQPGLVILDVDDTLIEPKVKMSKLIDLLKQKGEKTLVSEWRLGRQVILTDPMWPEFLSYLKDNFTTKALTQFDIGSYGSITSIEKWRYQELKSLGLFFEEGDDEVTEFYGGSYYGGIFFTGASNKRALVEKILAEGYYKSLVLVDDKNYQLEAMLLAAKDLQTVALEYRSLRLSDPLSVFEKQFIEKILASDLDEEIKAEANFLYNNAC